LIEEVEHAKRYACPGGIPIGFLSEEFHRAGPSGIPNGVLCD